MLDFLDLLLKARDALRDRESVRRHFRERFRFLIIDEFQDTDPLQVEIARAAGRGDARARWWWWATPSSRSTASAARTWRSSAASPPRRAARPGHAVLHLTPELPLAARPSCAS